MPPLQPRLSDPVCRRARSESVARGPPDAAQRRAAERGQRIDRQRAFSMRRIPEITYVPFCITMVASGAAASTIDLKSSAMLRLPWHITRWRSGCRSGNSPGRSCSPRLRSRRLAQPGYLAAALRRSARGTGARILPPAAHAWLVDGRSATCRCAQSAEAEHGWKATTCETATAAVHAASINFRDMCRSPAPAPAPRSGTRTPPRPPLATRDVMDVIKNG